MEASYREMECGCGHSHPVAIDLTDWQKTFAKIMQDTYEGKIKPGDLDAGDIADTYKKIAEGAAQGFGKGWEARPPKKDYEYSTIDPKVLQMKRNIYKFSAAKDATMLQSLNNALYHNGKLLSFDAFKQEALKIGAEFKERYLEAEYRTARQSGIMAQKWADIQNNRELFPNLKYRTQHDGRVRPEHAALDGIIAPIDSDFWKKYYPPNGWRCRCDAVQTAEEPTALIPPHFPDIKPEFEINVGQTGQIFKDGGNGQNSFFALATDDPKWKKSFEVAKLSAPSEVAYKAKNGATVSESIFADTKDLPLNRTQAKLIADELGLSSKIRPDVNTSKGYLENYTNPEYEFFDGILGDRKSVSSINNLGKIFDDAKAQMFDTRTNPEKKDYIICFDLDGVESIDWGKLEKQLGNKVQKNRGTHIDSLIFTLKGKAVRLTRVDLVSKDYKALEKLKKQ